MDYYILFIWGLVEPELIGPFQTVDDRDKQAKELFQKNGEQHGYYKITVPTGTKVEIDSYSGKFFEKY